MAATRRSRAQERAVVPSLPGLRRAAAFLPSRESVAVGLALLVLALGAYSVARVTSVFALRELRVEGATPALAREVRAALAPFRGESLLAFDGARVLAAVEAVPEVRAATYDRSFPHALTIVVERELPVALVRRGAESWLVSARGRALKRVARGTHPRLPRIWVPKQVPLERGAIVGSTHVVRGVGAAAALAPEGLPAAVRTVRVGPGELTFVLASGLELRLGDARELPLKLAVAAQILPGLDPPHAGGPTYLDVQVPERAVAGRAQVEGES